MTLKSSGYGGEQTVTFSGTRTLTSLADDEYTDESDEIDNGVSGVRWPLADFELALGSAAFTGTDSAVAMYILPSIDGTNFPDWTGDGITDEQENEQYYAGSFVTSGANAAQVLMLRNVQLPPGKFKIGVRNLSGVALAASGNALSYSPHSFVDE